MGRIVFDEGLSTEKTFEIDNAFERILDHAMNCVKTIDLSAGGTIPTIPPIDDPYFETVNVYSSTGVSVPIVDTYNKITGFTTQYFDSERTFSYNIDLGYEVTE